MLDISIVIHTKVAKLDYYAPLSPTLSSFQSIFSAPSKNAGNNILDFAD
jgi:hypothetical protein